VGTPFAGLSLAPTAARISEFDTPGVASIAWCATSETADWNRQSAVSCKMGQMFSARVLVFAVIGTATVIAQQVPTTTEGFDAADPAQKKQALVEIIRHELSTGPEVVAGMIRSGLVNNDAAMREGALAAVVSRAAGPRFSQLAAEDWPRDHQHIQALRPLVVQLLSDDPIEGVRVQAIAALVSLDFNIVSRDVELTPASERLLIDRFHLDASAKVRATIVAGFGTRQAADSAPG
jgi:hypothetical protein